MDSNTTVIIIPSIKKYRLLPRNAFDCQKDIYLFVQGVGFGFDSIAHDFKVVRIVNIYMIDSVDYPEEIDKKVHIHNMSVDCWRELDVAVDQPLTIFHCEDCITEEFVIEMDI